MDSLKFYHSPYVWQSSGDNVFTLISYPLTLWGCLSHITSLLLNIWEENWIVTSLSILEDNFWGLRVIQWIFFKGLVGWVTLLSSKFSRPIYPEWPLLDLEEFFYICLHWFLFFFFPFLGYVANKKMESRKSFRQRDLSYVLTLPFKRNLSCSRIKCKTNQVKTFVSPKWFFSTMADLYPWGFQSHSQGPSALSLVDRLCNRFWLRRGGVGSFSIIPTLV